MGGCREIGDDVGGGGRGDRVFWTWCVLDLVCEGGSSVKFRGESGKFLEKEREKRVCGDSGGRDMGRQGKAEQEQVWGLL